MSCWDSNATTLEFAQVVLHAQDDEDDEEDADDADEEEVADDDEQQEEDEEEDEADVAVSFQSKKSSDRDDCGMSAGAVFV
jgi:hypothetical protein